MIGSKEKLEDIRWLQELLDMYKNSIGHPNLKELAEEIKKVRARIKSNQYTK